MTVNLYQGIPDSVLLKILELNEDRGRKLYEAGDRI
jgi:hypothetical protein